MQLRTIIRQIVNYIVNSRMVFLKGDMHDAILTTFFWYNLFHGFGHVVIRTNTSRVPVLTVR